jgi:hypothetical protein
MEPSFVKNRDKNKKTFPGSGMWIEKPRRSEVLVCGACKGKYIKTRTGQTTCIRCISKTIGRTP